MTALVWHKRTAGVYVARTGDGEADRYKAACIDRTWFLTYPGQSRADSFCPSLTVAKQWAEEHAQVVERENARFLAAHCARRSG